MTERVEEQPFDDRHNTPPTHSGLNPFLTPQDLGALPHRHVEIHEPVRVVRMGLVWRAAPGVEMQDIGRMFTDSDALDNMHAVDLRTILAHLDSAALAVKAELDTRYRNGVRH